MDNFLCSVIIPVYNAEKYLEAAVESAVHLEEVGEIVLVEDKSPDNALAICKMLTQKYPKVKLFQHPGGQNRGAGASRNLGIQNASCDFISFLDADDYYLPHRFFSDKKLFSDNKVDGVYNSVVNVNLNNPDFKLIKTVNRQVPPKKLFHYLLRGTYGHFHTNGITLRKSLLNKIGGFDTSLKLHQDSELWLKCSKYGRLVAGTIDTPTAVVQTHGENRITSLSKASKYQLGLKLVDHYTITQVGPLNYLLVLRKALREATNKGEAFKILSKIKWS